MDDLAQQLRQAETSSAKERLQVLYWLKQDKALSISAIAKDLRRERERSGSQTASILSRTGWQAT